MCKLTARWNPKSLTDEQIATIVELQWLEHFWDHGNVFEIWVVRATEY